MDKTIKKVAIVTGGGSGIGAAITQKFIDNGYQVVVGQRSSSAIGNCCEVDLADSKDCEKLIKYCLEQYRRIDTLVNNAGVPKTDC